MTIVITSYRIRARYFIERINIMRFKKRLRKQPAHIKKAIVAALMGAIVEGITVFLTVTGVIPSWGPAAIVLVATLVIAGGLYRMPENNGVWGD